MTLFTTIFSTVLLFRLTACRPAHATHARIIERQTDLLDEYDYIIVGAGTVGLTVADRISESGEYTVLAIEYGYLDSSESILTVATPDVRAAGPDQYPAATRMFNISTVPQTAMDGRRKNIRAGCAVGGSSAVNGMLLDRGSAEDYDAWVLAAGEYADDYASEWGWDNMLPSFQKSVTFHPPTEEMQERFGYTYNTDGAYGNSTTPIHASYRPYQWPTQQLMFNAFKLIPGIESPQEAANGAKHGVLWAPNSIDAETERRSYAKTGHYDNIAAQRRNFHILPANRVTRINLVHSQSDNLWFPESVEYVPRDGPRRISQVRVRKEVVVSAGTFHTPQVLERSGVGPRNILEAAGVPVKVELPGVGHNFQSHTAFSVSYRFNRRVFPAQGDLSSNRTFQSEAQRLWDEDKSGPYTSYVNSGVYLPLPVFSNNTESIVDRIEAQSPQAYLPDGLDPTVIAGYAIQKDILVQQLRSRRSAWLESLFSGGSSFNGILLHIFSRGSVHISPGDDGVTTNPVIDYRTYTNPLDLDLNVELLRGIRWYMGHRAMVDALSPTETSPRITTDREIRSWLRQNTNADVAHQTGTASLGPKELGGVVGPDLRVHGTRGLSVADNSIIPLVPGSHTSAVAYAIGEKAADLILRRA
ncbi:hypothetical protein S7711_05918 [Stachybotrys chartarum IBT 7711]|uniref:Glucose-methanol-choline oxidoreductase N-terminal domain-containing protein n=1 Tax=Stachybotrys chartarum (strain CBS 109288 / IBT 7711) TaxID=1280523 RepID=A0A084B198_STACB|nr:hypothetical protein S7711_05918 [Stachybotrys chartarum IBT 7711]